MNADTQNSTRTRSQFLTVMILLIVGVGIIVILQTKDSIVNLSQKKRA